MKNKGQNNNKLERRIYLDYMASCPVDERVLNAMSPYWREFYGHPWALHKEGVKADQAFQSSTKTVADILGAKHEEVVFTSGGTESTTQAIKGLINYILNNNGTLDRLHIILSAIEHPSVGGVVEYVKNKGMDVSVVEVESNGIIDPKKIEKELRPETILVSIMYVNSEIGTVQPIKEISKIISRYKKSVKTPLVLPKSKIQCPVFHTDASQASLYFDCNVSKLGVDLLTIDGHKMYGPKGVGALFVRKGLLLEPLLFGHSGGRSYVRNGTPPIPLIIGLAKAYEIASSEREVASKKVSKIRDHLIKRILEEVPTAILNGDRELRTPQNASFSFKGVNHEFLLIQLDEKGIAVATRSACSSDDGDGSHVIKALFNHRKASAIRFSIGKETTKEEIDYVVEEIKKSIENT